jgi:hypothetical protein
VCWRGVLTPATGTLANGCSKLQVDSDQRAARRLAEVVAQWGDVDELIRRGDVCDK